jgi:hypothetical protein
MKTYIKILIVSFIVFAGVSTVPSLALAGNCQCSSNDVPEAYAVPAPSTVQECCTHCNKSAGDSIRWNGTVTECSASPTSGSTDGGTSSSSGTSQECGALAEGDNEWARERLTEAENADRGIFTEGLSAACMAFGCCGTCDILVVISNVFQFALSIVGILAVLVLVIAGIMYVTSGGNQEQVGKAKAALTAAVVGTVIVLAAWLIINAVLSAAGYSDGGSWFNPSC